MSRDYLTVPVVTGYIRPGEGFSEIIERAGALAMDGDFLVISETPISVAQGNLADESRFRPSITAVLLADIWSKYIWGYLLGPILGMKRRTIMNLRRLPPEARAHKEVVLRYYGLKHALKPASEAGIDLSNVPGTLVSLLPENPGEAANFIASEIRRKFGADVTAVIIDTDASYSILGRYFTSLPIAVPGIRSDTGFLGYIAGRFSGTIDLDPGPGENIHTAQNSSWTFVTKYSTTGEYQWGSVFGTTGYVTAFELDYGSNDMLYVTGDFSGETDFDPGPGEELVSAVDVTYTFINKLTSDGTY